MNEPSREPDAFLECATWLIAIVLAAAVLAGANGAYQRTDPQISPAATDANEVDWHASLLAY
jgi:hypothetical protein